MPPTTNPLAARRFRQAVALQRAQDWPAAAAAYRAAIHRDRRNPVLHARLGWVLTQNGEWAAAVDSYREALALDESRVKWHLQLGRALERTRDKDGAREAYAAALAHDPATIDADHVLLNAALRHFAARSRTARFVAQHLDEIRARAEQQTSAAPWPARPRVHIYWAQGIQHAPTVVRVCQAALSRRHRPDDVVVLDDNLLPHYVDLPPRVLRRTFDDKTKLSDVLRLELLWRYGGVWMDATCLPRQRVLDVVPDLLPSGFFAFTYRPARISSWFLASAPGNPVVAMVREAQFVHWEHNEKPLGYYVLHHLFESLYHLDEGFRAAYAPTPRVSSHPPSRFAREMHKPYDAGHYDELLGASFVHKLSYKYPTSDVTPDSMLSHLVRMEGRAG